MIETRGFTQSSSRWQLWIGYEPLTVVSTEYPLRFEWGERSAKSGKGLATGVRSRRFSVRRLRLLKE